MAAKTIRVPLTEAGIDKAIREVRQYKQKLLRDCKTLVERLTEKGVEIARVQIASMDNCSSLGWLSDSLDRALVSTDTGYIGYVRVNSSLGMFIEFGTGIKGAGHPHPLFAEFGWIYDSNGHGMDGWWYPTDEADPNPKKRYSEESGWYGWTRGMPSRPFLYNTSQTLKDELVQTAREVFGGD